MLQRQLDRIILSVITSRSELGTPINTLIPEVAVRNLLNSIREELKNEKCLLKLNGNINIVGDLHGNIDDLLRIFEDKGYPPMSTYLFLGDYVDREKNGLEILLMLYALKLKFPQNIFLLRGNHEIENMTVAYGFYDEVALKYSFKLYEDVIDTFQYLPIAAIVAKQYFCVHGGIGPDMPLLNDSCFENKPTAITGFFADMLWSDPRKQNVMFRNSERGSGHYFNEKAVDAFLKANQLKGIIRSHEYCEKGFNYEFDNEKCTTIFSSSDYCQNENKGCTAFLYSCGEIELSKFKPLTKSQRKKLRFTIPKFIYEDDEFTADSSPCSPICSCDENTDVESLYYYSTFV